MRGRGGPLALAMTGGGGGVEGVGGVEVPRCSYTQEEEEELRRNRCNLSFFVMILIMKGV